MPNIVSQIVEVTVFKARAGQPLFLILKRAENDLLYPGIWQIVTGMIEPGEGTVDAALREVREETGLVPRKLWRLPVVNSFYDPAGDLLQLCPNFAVAVNENAEPVLSKEHHSAEWCTLQRALSLLPWTGQRDAVRTVFERFWNETEEARLLEVRIPSP